MQVARDVGRFAGSTEHDFANWLYAIAINHCNWYLRKAGRRKKLFENFLNDHVAKTSDAGKTDSSDWPAVYAAISKLKPEHQTIITLRYFEDLSFERIGAIVNADPASVRVALHRILKKLKKQLEPAA